VTETIAAEAKASEHASRDKHLFGPGPKRVLSLDGGGVRGAISVAFLEHIESIFAERAYQDYLSTSDGVMASPEVREKKRRALADTARLGDYFDMVGGTSTGALIAGALALGYRTAEIKDFYLERAPKIFRRPFWRIPGLQAKFDARGLQAEINDIVKDRTLDSPDLRTGLCIVTKRMDTGAPWIIANNPRTPYWETKAPIPGQKGTGHIGNRHYKLATLVRASTAAPHFFDPEIIQILAEEEKLQAAKAQIATDAATAGDEKLGELNARLGRFPRLTLLLTKIRALRIARIAQQKGLNPETHGLFVDGGVTPFNNPSLAILMQVALKPYGICWPLGPENLTFVSVGTGSFRTRLSFTELGFAGPIKLALHALLSMMTDSQTYALAQMQWLGECPDPWPINSELGTLGDENPTARRWFRFMRYDVSLEQPWLCSKLKRELEEIEVLRYRNMDDPSIIRTIYDIAQICATEQVKASHFFPASEDAAVARTA
jgi:patatin-like phospholipase/acyl hydrolase